MNDTIVTILYKTVIYKVAKIVVKFIRDNCFIIQR